MANHTYSKGLLYKKTLNSSGEVTGSVPLLLKTLGSLVIMSDGTDAETAISTAISNMVTPDETTIVTGQDGITISVKKSTSAEIDEILGDVPTEHTWEGYYTKSEVNGLVNAVDAKFNQNDIETALGYTPIASSTKGSANGVASLDANGLVPSAQLPSYVDDVIESATFAALPATGETGKIYVTLNDNKTYRWSGSAYVEISQSLALGETSSTAFAGDKGKIAYDHASDTTKHIPTGGTNAQYLKNTGNNTYAWASPDSSWPATPTNNTIPGNKLVDDRFKANETNILYAINTGVRNICNNAEYSDGTKTAQNTTFTTLDDGTVTVKTPSGQTSTTDTNNFYNVWFVNPSTVLIPVGTWMCKLYGTDISNIRIEYAYTLNGTSSVTRGNFGEALEIVIPTGVTASWLRICAKPSTSFNSSFKIVVCDKTVWDTYTPTEYVPFALPNYDLTRLESEDRVSLAEVVDSGAKNLLDVLNRASVTTGGITCTFNSDGTITVNGTATGSPATYIYLYTTASGNNPWKAPNAGTYVMSCEGATTSDFCMYDDGNWGTTPTLNSERTLTKGQAVPIILRINNGKVLNNVTVKPMICTKAAFGVSQKFVPYAKSNYQLTTDMGNVNAVLEAVL